MLEYLARSEAVDGRYASAAAHAAEGLRLARETGQQNSVCHLLASLALIAAIQGREQECRTHAAEALELATARGLGYQSALAEWAIARLDLGLGQPAEALARLERLAAAGPGNGHPFVKIVSAPDLVEAAVRAKQAGTAQAALLEFERFARETAPPWALALVARCRALLSAGEAAEHHFLEALRRHGRARVRSTAPGRSSRSASTCAATGAARRRGRTYARPSTRSSAWAPAPGPSEPASSCVRAARAPASAVPVRSTN